VSIPDPQVVLWAGDETLEDNYDVWHFRLEGRFHSEKELFRLIQPKEVSIPVLWINGCALYQYSGSAFDEHGRDDIIAVGSSCGTLLLDYSDFEMLSSVKDTLRLLFAQNMFADRSLNIKGIDSIDLSLFRNIIKTNQNHVFEQCCFDARASTLLSQCSQSRFWYCYIHDNGDELVESMLSSNLKLTAISACCLAMLSYDNLLLLFRATLDRGGAPLVELAVDSLRYSYEGQPSFNLKIGSGWGEEGRVRALNLVRAINVSCCVTYESSNPIHERDLALFHTLHEEGLVKELRIEIDDRVPPGLKRLCTCISSVPKVYYDFVTNPLRCHHTFSGLEMVHGFRSLHFSFTQGQPLDLLNELVALIGDHDLMIGVYGLENGEEIVAAKIASNMLQVSKSTYLVPYLLARQGLSPSVRYEFLRLVVGSLTPVRLTKNPISAFRPSKRQLTSLGWLSRDQ